MPDAEWLVRLPLLTPFGTFAHDGKLPGHTWGSTSPHEEVPSSFDAESATAKAIYHWFYYSDYALFPHVQHCSSIPDLLHRLARADFASISGKMRDRYELMVHAGTVAFAQAAVTLLR